MNWNKCSEVLPPMLIHVLVASETCIHIAFRQEEKGYYPMWFLPDSENTGMRSTEITHWAWLPELSK